MNVTPDQKRLLTRKLRFIVDLRSPIVGANEVGGQQDRRPRRRGAETRCEVREPNAGNLGRKVAFGATQFQMVDALASCDAYILLLTEDGYDSIYVAHEVGVAAAGGKPLIALVDQSLAEKLMGLLADVEQVRFDRDDLAASTAAITTGLMRLGERRGVPVEPASIVMPTQPALFSVSV